MATKQCRNCNTTLNTINPVDGTPVSPPATGPIFYELQIVSQDVQGVPSVSPYWHGCTSCITNPTYNAQFFLSQRVDGPNGNYVRLTFVKV